MNKLGIYLLLCSIITSLSSIYVLYTESSIHIKALASLAAFISIISFIIYDLNTGDSKDD